jgi:rhomboid protease GluP
MVHGESFDVLGKNKKSTAAFVQAFEAAKSTISQTTIENNKSAINTLRETTAITAVKEQKEAAEITEAMNLEGSNLYVTYAIIAINVLVFILMAINGAGIFDANGLVHIKWGSNYTPLTLSGDWWRLITNVFIHFGIIHLLMNMYCLYTVGIYLEPMLGKVKYTVAYLCTGVLASVASLWWHKDGVNSAGASGAIFGMYGLFLALLTTNLIPQKVRQALLQSIGIFVVYNLAYGMKSGVDNAAHVGGLVSGFIIGYIYVLGIKKEKQGQKLQWIVPMVALLSVGAAYSYLQQNKISSENHDKILAGVKDAAYKDSEKFDAVLKEIEAIEEKAIAPLGDTTLTNPELKSKIDSLCYPMWNTAEVKLKATEQYDVSASMHTRAAKLLEYARLRKDELDIYLKMINTGKSEDLIPQLNDVRKKMNALGSEMQKL